MLIQSPTREYQTWIFDSRRWQRYNPRPDDMIIATYPKCGTAWMQRIVGLLIFQSTEPKPIMQISVWIDRRFPQLIIQRQQSVLAEGDDDRLLFDRQHRRSRLWRSGRHVGD